MTEPFTPVHWNDVAAVCSKCGTGLLWLEGPVCDSCLDEDEHALHGRDPYELFREESSNPAYDGILESGVRTIPGGRGERGGPGLAKTHARLSVNLETGEVLAARRSA